MVPLRDTCVRYQEAYAGRGQEVPRPERSVDQNTTTTAARVMHDVERRPDCAMALGETNASVAVVRHSFHLLFGCLFACAAAACGGNSISTSTAPSAVKCATNLSG